MARRVAARLSVQCVCLESGAQTPQKLRSEDPLVGPQGFVTSSLTRPVYTK